ncbi:MAG TPA: hypothetical protein VNT50_03785 [Microbacterium sp.]|uniref:hypothetical protein n=1 Tax=Microbacterium sp. TaxID=51671 RepID=UPI002C4B4886|nr:hypothetical protein [Microbacterium sp.]HWI30586.1 hypothetical protein [Microbacterium sp.]
MPTRVILICAAFGALQSLLFAAVAPVTIALAPVAPPAYAVIAGVHSLLPFLARLVTGVTGAATITGLITGILAAAITPLGALVIVPLALAGAAFDAALPWRGPWRRPRSISPIGWGRLTLGGVAAAVVLFAVSLPVFSSEHLSPPVLVATLAGRLAGELAAVALAAVTARRLTRAGLQGTGSV